MSNFVGELNPNYKTGLRARGAKSSLYSSWLGMKQRCNNPKNPKYKNYGGRGIKVCEEWNDIRVFYKWSLENGWEEGLSIDRIDNNRGYEPDNCRWVSVCENSRKKSTTKITDKMANEIRSRKNENWYDLAKEYGCSHGNIWFIMHGFTHTKDGECSKKLKERKSLKK